MSPAVLRTEAFRLGRREGQERPLTLVEVFRRHFTEATGDASMRIILSFSLFQQEGTVLGDALRRVGYLLGRSLSRDLREHVLHGVMVHGGSRTIFNDQKEGFRRHTEA